MNRTLSPNWRLRFAPQNVDNVDDDDDNFGDGDDHDNGDIYDDDVDDDSDSEDDGINDDRDGRQLKPHLILSIEFLLPSLAHPDQHIISIIIIIITIITIIIIGPQS